MAGIKQSRAEGDPATFDITDGTVTFFNYQMRKAAFGVCILHDIYFCPKKWGMLEGNFKNKNNYNNSHK